MPSDRFQAIGSNVWLLLPTAYCLLLSLSGCRTATRVIEEPRVDLEVTGKGNRGYLVGTPPPATQPEQTTRQMVETEIEVSGFSKSRQAHAPASASLPDVAPPETGLSEKGSASDHTAPQRFDTYLVKKGDTLWSIAADPAVFGDATKWQKLYAANRDTLKTPDQLRAGLTLRIPRGGPEAQEAPAKHPEGETSFKK